MGGAPPPPLGAAPQAPKIRKNSALWRAGFGRVEGPRITPRRGGGGAPATALIRGQREAAGDSPPPFCRAREAGSTVLAVLVLVSV